MKKDKNEIIFIINKLMSGSGTDSDQEKWVNEIKESVPFYEKIINLIFWSNEEMSADAIYEKAESEYKPIIL